MSRRAVILAGGQGTRLRPYTIVFPKPLMPVGDYPILEIIIRQLVWHGFDHITLAVNHRAEMIRTFFGDGNKWGVKIDYSLEEIPLSTMGPLSLLTNLPENFLIMNGDILTDLNFSEFYNDHVSRKSIYTVSSYVREHVNLYGVIEVDNANKMIGFKEKPVSCFEVSMGIYMANREILEFIPHNVAHGFDTLMLELIRKGRNANVRRFSGYWLDIGRPDDYMQAIDEFESKKTIFLKKP